MTSDQKYKQLGADYHWRWAKAGDSNPYVRWLKRVLSDLPEDGQGATVLDWGCGDGYPASLLVERGFWELDAPIERVCSAEVPIPYARHLELAALPSVEGIVAAVRRVLHA